jgi:asparagine synthase (glutamine-hydrolysing)
MGMAASLESRVPFLANGMFDLAFHLPRSAKLQGGTAKWVVKKAAERRLPRDVVYAPKKGFPMPPFYSRGTPRLLQGGLLAQQLEWSAPTTARIVAMIDQEYELRSLLVSLELWLRLFFDGQQPDALGERLMALAA